MAQFDDGPDVRSGNDVIVDDLPFDDEMARDAVRVWADLDRA